MVWREGQQGAKEEVQFLALFPEALWAPELYLCWAAALVAGRASVWTLALGPGGGGELQGSCPSLESFPGVHLQLPPGFSCLLRLPTLLLSLSHGSISGSGVTSHISLPEPE